MLNRIYFLLVILHWTSPRPHISATTQFKSHNLHWSTLEFCTYKMILIYFSYDLIIWFILWIYASAFRLLASYVILLAFNYSFSLAHFCFLVFVFSNQIKWKPSLTFLPVLAVREGCEDNWLHRLLPKAQICAVTHRCCSFSLSLPSSHQLLRFGFFPFFLL